MQQSTLLALDFPCDQLLKPKLMSSYNLQHALFCTLDLDNACVSTAESIKYSSWEQVLKATIEVKSNHLWTVVDKQCYLVSGSVGIPVRLCSRFLWSSPFLPRLMLSVLCCSVNAEGSPLLGTDRHTERHTGTDIGANRFTKPLQTATDSNSYRQIRSCRECREFNSRLILGEGFWFLSSYVTPVHYW